MSEVEARVAAWNAAGASDEGKIPLTAGYAIPGEEPPAPLAAGLVLGGRKMFSAAGKTLVGAARRAAPIRAALGERTVLDRAAPPRASGVSTTAAIVAVLALAAAGGAVYVLRKRGTL